MKTSVTSLALLGATVAFLVSAAACSPKPEEHAEESAAAEHAPGDLPATDDDATARQDAEAAIAAAMAASPTATDTPVASAPTSSSQASAAAAH